VNPFLHVSRSASGLLPGAIQKRQPYSAVSVVQHTVGHALRAHSAPGLLPGAVSHQHALLRVHCAARSSSPLPMVLRTTAGIALSAYSACPFVRLKETADPLCPWCSGATAVLADHQHTLVSALGAAHGRRILVPTHKLRGTTAGCYETISATLRVHRHSSGDILCIIRSASGSLPEC
jgi:hypothetical protein